MTARTVPLPSAKAELCALMLVAWVALIAIPLCQGGIGLSWDALNHQVYLGWTAQSPRFDRDFLAASYQSFQYPYLYWPLYKLVSGGWTGEWAGVALNSFVLAAVPPLWMLALAGVPERSWYGVGMRWLAVAMAFLTGAVLSLLDSTANDLLAAIPFVWAIALAVAPLDANRPWRLGSTTWVLLSGLAAGVAVAFKLSNGPLALVLPLVWALHGRSPWRRLSHVAVGGIATLLAFAICYGPWAWELWTHFGNPVYPFCENWFAPLRAWIGWRA